MARCTYIGSCPFPNDKLANMPVTTSFMSDNYCYWNFTKCGIYRTAVDLRSQNISSDMISEGNFLSDKILNWLICGRIGW
ncbi:hypothetical protein GMSM_19090 [Geomonas sp. Red276]